MDKKYEVVISGISGRFPESDNCEELFKNLMNKTDLITDDDRRWKKAPPMEEVPNHTGKISERDTVDMTFFGIHRRLCEVTDPHHRISLEIAFSAILDAGVNPNDLWGTDTAVIASSVTSETEYECMMYIMQIGLSILGQSRSMQANRISYSLNLCGPSLMIDGNWNGSCDGLAYAADLIQKGVIPSAVVVSCSILFSAEVAYHYYRMGRLTPKGRTMCFSDDADGYNRSESAVGFFLQRKEDALRSYGSPMMTSTYFIGSKRGAFSETSRESLRWYLETFYSSIKVEPWQVGYVEAAGVASKVVDAAELNAMSDVMLAGRKDPLLVGCVKSNLGHSEACASSLSLIKVLLASNNGIIPPNLHYNKPNSLVPSLQSGEIKVVTEPTPLEGDYVAANSISATGGFSHMIIKRFNKMKSRKPEKGVLPIDGLPRLVLVSGRNEEGLQEVLKRVDERPIDEEYVALVNRVFSKGIKKHLYRGYTVQNDKEKIYSSTKAFFTGSQTVQPVWWVFTGMGSQWPGMGTQLMKLPVFARAINKCHDILKPKGVDLIHIITTLDPTIYDNILHSFVGIAAIQIGLVDVLREVGLKPDGIVGHSVGELGCAYADGCFTAEQMILAAYARGRASVEAELIQGMMAAVGRGYKQMKDDLPDGIEVACHNSVDSCTLSGPTSMMEEYIGKLKDQGIFAKLVNVANIAYHSKYIRPAAPALLKYLKEVIPTPKPRSEKWISSSVPESEWGRESARFSSAEYHTNNLLGSVLFEEATAHVPKNAVIVEIAPHGLLQAILKRSFPAAVNIPLTNRMDHNGLCVLFSALGKLYNEGVEFEIEKLYPPVEFPVSQGTPSLNDTVIWDHSEQWRINVANTFENYDPEALEATKPRNVDVQLSNDTFKILKEYTIFNKVTIPLSFYLVNVIEYFQEIIKSSTETLKIQDIKLKKHVDVESGQTGLYVSVGKGFGGWEVCHGMEAAASGTISSELYRLKTIGLPTIGTDLSGEQIYSYLSHMGHKLGPSFRLIKSATISNKDVSALVEWNGDMMCFLDSVFKLPVLQTIRFSKLNIVDSINELTIDFSQFPQSQKKEVVVNYNSHTGVLVCEGLEALYPKSTFPNNGKHPERTINCEELQFVPYEAFNITDIYKLLELTINLLMNNVHDLSDPNIKLSVFEIQETFNVHDQLHSVLEWGSQIQVNMKVTSTDSSLESYTSDSETEYSLILTGSNEFHNSIRVLNMSCGGFILIKGHQPPSDLAVVFSTTINNEQYFLCKCKRPLKENPTCVLMTTEDWQAQLKDALADPGKQPVYLIGRETSLSCINNLTLDCNQFVNSNLLRFVIIDSDVSEFNLINSRDQIEQDLRVNIYHSGKWGVCLAHLIDLELPEKNTALFVYPFSDIRSEGAVTPRAVSLNLTDISCTSKKMEVLEYSGMCCAASTCGIGKFMKISRMIQPDPVFQWKIPEGWSDEDVCSVLMPYTMAFYMLKLMPVHRDFFGKGTKSLLIFQGLLPLSQATIRVALDIGREVYTSYGSQDEKERIMKMFPQIPEENLLNTESPHYLFSLLKKTEGKGIHIVVNTLPDMETVKACVKLMGEEGLLFQASQPAMKQGEKIGMLLFVKQVCVEGINPISMLDLHEDHKKEIHHHVQEGFDSGLIKPISNIVLPPDTINIDAVSAARDKSNMDKKVVVKMSKKSNVNTNGLYVCNINGRYVILGDEHGFWLDLLEWLVTRGATNVYLVLTKDMLSGAGKEGLNKMQLLNPHVNIIITPETRVMSSPDVQIFIKEINRFSDVDTVFILGKFFKGSVEYFNEVLKENKLVVVCEEAALLCDKRISSGLPTLAISVAQDLQTSHTLIPRLDKLMQMERQNIIIREQCINKSIGIDAERTAFVQHLPSTVKEILELEKHPKEADWREVKTSSPAFAYCPELPPIFVIPPLKTRQFSAIYRNLFHPTFVAVTPQHFKDFEDLGMQLYQALKRFNIGVFTIICSDWSWLVGLSVGRLLEADGKNVSLIFFEASINWESPLISQNVRCLVNRDLTHMTLSESKREKLAERVETAYKNLKFRLNLFAQSYPEVQNKLRGVCYYIRPNILLKEERINKIQAYCEKPLNVYTTDGFDFQRIMEERNMVNYINQLTLFEYKDAANKVEKVVLKDSYFDNPRLSYLKFTEDLSKKSQSLNDQTNGIVIDL